MFPVESFSVEFSRLNLPPVSSTQSNVPNRIYPVGSNQLFPVLQRPWSLLCDQDSLLYFLYSDLHIELKEMLHLPRSNANQFMVSVQILYWRMNLLWRNDVRAESS